MAYPGGETDMTVGLQLMRTELFNETNGDRSQVQNVAVILTDGIPARELDQLLAEVQRTKDSGIRIVAVGITDEVTILSGRAMTIFESFITDNYCKLLEFYGRKLNASVTFSL